MTLDEIYSSLRAQFGDNKIGVTLGINVESESSFDIEEFKTLLGSIQKALVEDSTSSTFANSVDIGQHVYKDYTRHSGSGYISLASYNSSPTESSI